MHTEQQKWYHSDWFVYLSTLIGFLAMIVSNYIYYKGHLVW